MLVITALLGGGMLLSDMKGFSFKLPTLDQLKKLLPQRIDDEQDETEPGLATFAEIEQRQPFHHELLAAERAPLSVAAVAPTPLPAAVHVVHIETETEPELAPGTYDVHQPNLNRSDLEEPDPEIEAVVASLAGEVPAPEAVTEAAPVDQPVPDADSDNLMSFFEEVAEISKMPTTLTEGLAPVTATELLSEARALQEMLGGRRDAA